jgi:hypothetical protein
MLERLHLKRSEQPSSEGRKRIPSVVKLLRGSLVACCLTLPSLSSHIPENQAPHQEQQKIDRMKVLLETTIQKLFEDVTVAEVLGVFSMSPKEFQCEHPKQYGLSITLGEALCLEPDRFQESYNLFIQHLCENAKRHDFPLPEWMIRTLITEDMIHDELAFLLKHNREQEASARVNVVPSIRRFLHEEDRRLAMNGTP